VWCRLIRFPFSTRSDIIRIIEKIFPPVFLLKDGNRAIILTVIIIITIIVITIITITINIIITVSIAIITVIIIVLIDILSRSVVNNIYCIQGGPF